MFLLVDAKVEFLRLQDQFSQDGDAFNVCRVWCAFKKVEGEAIDVRNLDKFQWVYFLRRLLYVPIHNQVNRNVSIRSHSSELILNRFPNAPTRCSRWSAQLLYVVISTGSSTIWWSCSASGERHPTPIICSWEIMLIVDTTQWRRWRYLWRWRSAIVTASPYCEEITKAARLHKCEWPSMFFSFAAVTLTYYRVLLEQFRCFDSMKRVLGSRKRGVV